MKYKRIDIAKVNNNNILFDGIQLDSTILSVDKSFQRLIDIYKKLIWIHANPSNPNIVKESEDRFILEGHREKFLQNLTKQIEDDNIRLVLLEGKRGAGKTFVQNYFLNTRMPNMQDTTWFRVDVTKIYYFNTINISKSIDFEMYLWAQIVFVFFRYAESHIDNTITYGYDKNFSAITDDEVFKDVPLNIDEKKQFKKNIIDTPHDHDSISGKPFFHKDTKTIALNILSKLREKKVNIVLFIDGIDNISLADTKYRKSRRDINTFIQSFLEKSRDDVQDFSKIIFSSREELDIENSLKKTLQNIGLYKRVSKKLSVTPISVDKIVTHLIEYAKSINAVLPVMLKDDLLIIAQCIEKILISKTVKKDERNKKSINDDNLSYSFFTNNLFDGDSREAFFGLISTYYFVKKHLLNVKNYGQKINNISEILKHGNRRVVQELQAVVIEGIFKNGCFYTPDINIVKYLPPYRGLGFTNMFNPAFYYTLDYHPLLSLYLLHYLKRGSVTLEELRHKCTDFGLCENETKTYNAVQVLIEFNYLELQTQNNVQTVSITQKGKIVFEMTLGNLDIFSSNIYNALQSDKRPIAIEVYETDGKRYRIVQLRNIVRYVTFLENLQQYLCDLLKDDVLSEFNKNVKIDFIKRLAPSYIEVFNSLKYTYEDIVESFTDREKDTFNRLLYSPKNYLECNYRIQKMKKIDFYSILNEFLLDLNFDKEDNVPSILDSKNMISENEIKIILIFRILEKKEESRKSIDDFLFEIDDSKSLRNIIKLEKDDIEFVLKEYRENVGEHIDVWIYISELLTRFCDIVLKLNEKV